MSKKMSKKINIMHICDYGVGVEISIIYACILKFKSNIH